jgi:hypothetical protein
MKKGTKKKSLSKSLWGRVNTAEGDNWLKKIGKKKIKLL